MLSATLFTIAKIWNQLKCSSIDKWMWGVCVCVYIYIYIYTMECYSAIKKNEILLFVTVWMDLESIILSEISQTEKDKYIWLSLINTYRYICMYVYIYMYTYIYRYIYMYNWITLFYTICCLHMESKKKWYVCVCLVIQVCQTLCNPTDCCLPGSSVHRIL